VEPALVPKSRESNPPVPSKNCNAVLGLARETLQPVLKRIQGLQHSSTSSSQIGTSFFATATDLITVVAWAMCYISTMASIIDVSKAAVVFDIDETVLTRVATGGSSRFEPMYELYCYILSLGISVYFVTARSNEGRNAEATREELADLGFTQFSSLYLMPPEYKPLTNYSLYKFRARQNIVASGKEILLSIGDNWADVALLKPFCANPSIDQSAERVKQVTFLQTLPQNLYYVLKTFDFAWMGIKLPSI
jgi:hypothetical protein